MANASIAGTPKMMAVSAVMVRCGCGAPQSHFEKPCPQGVTVDMGQIAYWHKNPLTRLTYFINRLKNKMISTLKNSK